MIADYWLRGVLAAFVILVLGCPASVLAHGGGIDAHGGHHHRATGTYHFHRGKLKGLSFPNKAAALAKLHGGSQASAAQLPSTQRPRPNPSRLDSSFIEGAQEAALGWKGAEVAGVSYVVDGDTVALINKDGHLVKVRLIGVDTPETVHPTKPVEYYGREASLFLSNLLKGESVYVVYDQKRVDKFGRVLAYLYRVPDGLFVNAEIVRQGYGHAYMRFPFRHMELFRGYQQMAQEAGRGLWAQ